MVHVLLILFVRTIIHCGQGIVLGENKGDLMSVKLQIIKVTADGEQVSIEANLERRDFEAIDKGVSLRAIFDPYFLLIDDRLLEMNKRIMAMNYMVKKLPVEAQVAINSIWDVLHGKVPGPAIDHILIDAKAEYDAARAKLEGNEKGTVQGKPVEGVGGDPATVEAPRGTSHEKLPDHSEILKDTVS